MTGNRVRERGLKLTFYNIIAEKEQVIASSTALPFKVYHCVRQMSQNTNNFI